MTQKRKGERGGVFFRIFLVKGKKTQKGACSAPSPADRVKVKHKVEQISRLCLGEL